MATKSAAAANPANAPWDFGVPEAATAVVKRIEGFYPNPYDDNGNLPGGTMTIGYGAISDLQGKPITRKTPPVTEAEAVVLLRRDMGHAAGSVKTLVKVPLKSCEAAALISWTFNLGFGSLRDSTLLKRLNAGAKGEVPEQMRRWINHEGKPLVGLLRRRWAEAAIFQGIDGTAACVRAWKEINELGDWPAFS